MNRAVLLLLAAIVATAGAYVDEKSLTVEVDKCTTIAVGKSAGTEGPMATHTADCLDCDFRIAKTPAKDWPAGSTRPLYVYKGNYPAVVSKDRGSTWHPDNLEGTEAQKKAWGTESPVTGRIPQVPHTYALLEAGYGLMNEFQVGIGESTCAGRFWSKPTIAGGKAMVEIRQLSLLALERTKTARDAIKLMGAIAQKYGYYGADWSGGDVALAEAGEALTVVDKEEAWVFHILADDTGSSAVWAAQRVPDDHVAAISNAFIIREIKPGHPDFLYSSNIFDVAIRNNLYDPTIGESLDFLKCFGVPRIHPTYVHRRRWRVFDIVAPSLHIPGDTDSWANNYPFSVKADKPVSPADLMRIQRDHFEGTPYDLTKGLAAGPYGDPNRFDWGASDTMNASEVVKGSFERAISLFRTSYSIVTTGRQVPDDLALLWLTQHAPSSSSFAPFYVKIEDIPKPYKTGSLFKYDNNIPFWNFVAVGNYGARFYKYAFTDIAALQHRLEENSFAAVRSLETVLLPLIQSRSIPTDGIVKALTELSTSQADAIVSSWRDMLGNLITKYHDGYRAEDLDKPDINMKKLFYPVWWLKAVGFFDSVPNSEPGVIMFLPNPFSAGSGSSPSFASWLMTILSTALLSSIATILVQRTVAKRHQAAIQQQEVQSGGGGNGIYQQVGIPMKYASYQPQAQSESEADQQEKGAAATGAATAGAGGSIQMPSLNPLNMMRRKEYVELAI